MSNLIKPVDAEDLARLRELDRARGAIADRNLHLDLEKITTLAAGKRLEEDYANVIARIMRDRGIPPSSTIEVNARTGEVAVTPADSGKDTVRPAEAESGTPSAS